MPDIAPTVVVAGATGYIGRHVARALHETGYRVRALAREERKLAPVRDACDEVFIGEATRAETLTGLCDGGGDRIARTADLASPVWPSGR